MSETVHTTHCCPWHGCKYADKDCPVALGEAAPFYPRHNDCELCEPRWIDKNRLNDAKWAACNQRYPTDGHPPTMEWCSQLAEDVVRTYLGLSPEEWEELNA